MWSFFVASRKGMAAVRHRGHLCATFPSHLPISVSASWCVLLVMLGLNHNINKTKQNLTLLFRSPSGKIMTTFG